MTHHSLTKYSYLVLGSLLLLCFLTFRSSSFAPASFSLGKTVDSLLDVIGFEHHKTRGIYEDYQDDIWTRSLNSRANTIPTNWTQKGCYSDSTSTRTLQGYATSSSSNTPTWCLNQCSSRGYVYGGVEYGQECYCSNSMVVSSSTGQPEALSDCSMTCTGDSSQTCGSSYRILIYIYSPPLQPGWSGKGCYTDSTSSRTLSSYSTSSSSNTPTWCIDTCASRGYSLAGVEYSWECYCANSMVVGTTTGQAAPGSDCSSNCAGDPALNCGGNSRIYIYQLSSSTTTSTTSSASPTQSASYTSLGCYVDSSTRLLSGASTNFPTTDSPSVCGAYCNQRSFAYFGVEYGSECYCGNTLTGSTASSTDCNSPCSGDSTQQCGGTWRINVYSISGSSTTSQTTTPTTTTSSTPSPTQSASYTGLGCFVDSSTRVLSGPATNFPNTNSPSVCATYCSSYAYFGVEYSSECYCGNALSAQSAPSSDCNSPCSGNSAISCGGTWRINVYSVGGSSTTTTSTTTSTTMTTSTTSSSASPSPTTGWVSLGCYTDTSSPRALGGTSTTSSSDTPAWCQSYCSAQGYSYAGVEYGHECYCANSITSSTNGGQPASLSDCNMACAGDASQTCGSSYRINIYQYLGTPPNSNGKVVVAHVIVGITYSFSQGTWASHIATAISGGIDGFALNVGSSSWQPGQVASAYAAAVGTNFKLFLSFDMTAVPCGDAGSANLLRQYINNYANHPNQLYYQGKQVVSTFAGDSCTFGQGDLNNGWNYAVKQGVSSSVMFIPSFFSDPSTFSSNWAQDGDFNWNGGWPMGDYDVNFSSDQSHINAIGGKKFIAALTPMFYTHYGPNSWNKNWIYRSDDWLYNSRWEMLIQNRAQIDIVEIVSWNDYGESHYVGPLGPDLAGADAWVTGFDHQGFLVMNKYYADAWKTGTYATITKNQIFLFARPHPKGAVASNDPVGPPNNRDWTDDNLYAVVFAASSANGGSLQLSIGSSSNTFSVSTGVNKFKLSLSPGSPSAILKDSGGATLITFSPSNFNYVNNPTTYNFNYYMAASP